jgi:hypothetical protein
MKMLQLKYLSGTLISMLSIYVPLGITETIGTTETIETFFPVPLTFAFINA